MAQINQMTEIEMTKIEELELELAARKIVEGSELEWLAVIRHRPTKNNLAYPLEVYFTEHVEIALGIIEGKPVWEGDTLYFPSGESIIAKSYTALNIKAGGVFDLSWNPPKPKTVMVELPINIVQEIATTHSHGWYATINQACKKALEELNK